MAAVSIPPSPHAIQAMTNRRVPLANLQNATNSPLRAPVIGAKRQRSFASEQRDIPYGQPPPAKKLLVEVDDAESTRYGLGRRSGAPPTALQKRLEAAREGKTELKPVERSQAQKVLDAQGLETIRQWQKHYKRMFPSYVFYFESFPEDMRTTVSRQTHILGSREVKFFSKEVTHVITTRPFPPETDSSGTSGRSQTTNAARTVNPAAVEKKSIIDVALQRGNNGDVLLRAREMGIKIWSAEKLQRIMRTMFNTDTGEQPPDYAPTHRGTAAVQSKVGRHADLQKLLQNEKLNGPADRDFAAPTQEMVPLRGYYVYVHDMDEITRPVMIREYAKVANKLDGKWPQFRVTGAGKCPFIEDNSHTRRPQQEERPKAPINAPRTRAAAAMQSNQANDRRILGENSNLAKPASVIQKDEKQENAKPLDPPKSLTSEKQNTDNMPPMFGSAQASIRAVPRFVAGEPIASGIQMSNVTSAIRSQAISSTAAAPGAKAGISKEVNQLKRKVLEKNSVPMATSGQSSIMNDMRAAINQDYPPPTRAAKRKAQETLGQINEDDSPEEQERQSRKTVIVRRRKATTEKELKPGYCENCREKFNDFDEHTLSRKHRKFATSMENWRELDELLSHLVRQ